MPRELTIGNGSPQVVFDAAYQLRDIYFPYVGQENHTVGHLFRFGIFTERQLSWINEPEWERHLVYELDALVTSVRLINRRLGRSDTHVPLAYCKSDYIRSESVPSRYAH